MEASLNYIKTYRSPQDPDASSCPSSIILYQLHHHQLVFQILMTFELEMVMENALTMHPSRLFTHVLEILVPNLEFLR